MPTRGAKAGDSHLLPNAFWVMDKRSLTERDICTKFILPPIKGFGWDGMVQVRGEVYFTKGRIIVRGKLVTRGKAKKADFFLYYKPSIPIALIEAEDKHHSVGDGISRLRQNAGYNLEAGHERKHHSETAS